MEACISIPGLVSSPLLLSSCLAFSHFLPPLPPYVHVFRHSITALTYRPEKITVRYLDRNGKKIENQFSGFQSRLFLHEMQHLSGVLFTDHPECNRMFEDNAEKVTLPDSLPQVVTTEAEFAKMDKRRSEAAAAANAANKK